MCSGRCATRLGLTLEVAGVDHGLRPAAAESSSWCARAPRRSGCRSSAWRSTSRGARRGAGLQEAARRARLGALAALAPSAGRRRIALGHQADDQAETVLFRHRARDRARRACGDPLPAGSVRPAAARLFGARRSCATSAGGASPSSRTPPTPTCGSRARASATPPAARSAERTRGSRRRWWRWPRPRATAARGAAGERGRCGPALPRRVAAAVEGCARAAGPRRSTSAGGRRVEVSYGEVRVGPRALAPPARAPRAPLVIDGPGAYRWSAGTLDVGGARRRARARAVPPAEFDADLLDWPLVVRARSGRSHAAARRPGEPQALRPDDRRARSPARARAALPVVTSARGELLFVPGLRPAEIGAADRAHPPRRLVSISAPGTASERHLT